MNNPADTFRELRQRYFDGSESFMAGGHQILKIRRIKRKTPDWVNDEKKIRVVLLRSFSSLKTNQTHRSHAARWARVIHLYYRVGMTQGQVAAEMGITSKAVNNVLRSISNAMKGKKANGTGFLSVRKNDQRG
ncbi:Uncharacterised protein [uncultured archaeon]|nr:Uncharacterised protein [uncultured archaeon]